MKITGYESENGNVTAITVTDETRGFYDKRFVPERPHGEWLSHYEYCKKHDCLPSGLIAFWWCNQCEQGVEITTNFCPNCGALMKEGEAE